MPKPTPDMMVTGPALELLKAARQIRVGDWVRMGSSIRIGRDPGLPSLERGAIVRLEDTPLGFFDLPHSNIIGCVSPGGGVGGVWWIYYEYIDGWYREPEDG